MQKPVNMDTAEGEGERERVIGFQNVSASKGPELKVPSFIPEKMMFGRQRP